jgi:hypothetical protein
VIPRWRNIKSSLMRMDKSSEGVERQGELMHLASPSFAKQRPLEDHPPILVKVFQCVLLAIIEQHHILPLLPLAHLVALLEPGPMPLIKPVLAPLAPPLIPALLPALLPPGPSSYCLTSASCMPSCRPSSCAW